MSDTTSTPTVVLPPEPFSPELEEVCEKINAALEDEQLARTITRVAEANKLKNVRHAARLSKQTWVDLGATVVQADILVTTFNTSETSPIPKVGVATSSVDPNAELPAGKNPTTSQVTGFANVLGIDPMMLMMLMNGGGGDLSISDVIPPRTVVEGYNPKIRNLFMVLMTRLEERFSVPIVVVDADGSVNKQLTTEYIESLDEGRAPTEDDVYYGADRVPHELIRVGVDKQSVYDADPLNPDNELTKSCMGTGRICWKDVSLEVRQVAYFAAVKTGELNPSNETHLGWLQDNIKPGIQKLAFHLKAPKALSLYNEAARSGSLPTLRKSVTGRPARRPEIMARRRRATPTNMGDSTLGPQTSDGVGRWDNRDRTNG